jgi:hypothetical protein
MKVRVYLHLGLWCALFAAFLGFSFPTVGPAVMQNKIGPIDPNHSIDSYLRGLTHLDHASELFSNLIETVPRDKSVAIFTDEESSPSEFLGMLVAYLAWPHNVQIVKVRRSTIDREFAEIHSSSFGGLFFCDITPPPSLENATRFGSSIVFVAVKATGSDQ